MLSLINSENANNINKSNNGVKQCTLTFVNSERLTVLLINNFKLNEFNSTINTPVLSNYNLV